MTRQASQDVSGDFPILGELDFFNHAGVAPISGAAAKAVRRYADQAAGKAYVDSGWYSNVRRIKAQIGRLINAGDGPAEIAFVPNTSTGLALVANGLDWSPGDNVVITNVEYPANRYPWENLRRRQGVELREVEQQPDGRIDVEDVIEAISNRTRVVAISHVQYSTGYRIDLRPIADMVHKAGGYLCVDAIQSVGAMPVDVQALGIDFLSADGHKWLLAPEGCGIFYCKADLCELLYPTVVGWMNMVNATDFGNYQFELLPDARRFEPGSYNIAGILGLAASVEMFLALGMDHVWQRIDALTTRLCDGLERKGYAIFSPRRQGKDTTERSGIVTFTPPVGKPPVAQIASDLEQHKIILVVREGRLRASPHFYNTPDQIDRLLDALP